MRVCLTARLSRAAFGLLAVWCLGCTSFDVVFQALIAGAPRAGCAMSAEVPVQSGHNVASSPSTDSSRGCGCDHCIAVQGDPTELALVPVGTPDTVQHRPGSPVSVTREPLVPPPIASIAI